MKMKTVLSAFLAAGFLGQVAMANDSTGVLHQGLGETCSVVATVVGDGSGSNGGGCGGGASKTVRVAYSLGIFSGKTYQLVASYVDSSDRQTSLSLSGTGAYQGSDGYTYVSTPVDDVVTLNASYEANLGDYQLKLSLVNADTGAEVCASSQMLHVK